MGKQATKPTTKRDANTQPSPQGVKHPSEPTVADLNLTCVVGALVAAGEIRQLPSGDDLMSFSVTVRANDQKTTSVPAVWFDPPKRARQWKAGDRIVIAGSVVRRFYRGGGGLGSSTEVVIRRGELLRHGGKARAVIDSAVAGLTHV